MNTNIFTIIQSLFSAFAHSSFFGFIKILAGSIIAILLVADILLLSKRVRGDWKTAFYGAKVPSLKKSKNTEKWEEIKRNAESGEYVQGQNCHDRSGTDVRRDVGKNRIQRTRNG